MKKFFTLPITVLLVVLLSACSGTSEVPIEPNNENMIINIKNNANFDLYGMEVNILDHSPMSVNADGSKVKKGDTHIFEFLPEDFELEGEATMKVSILTTHNVESKEEVVPIEKEVPIKLDNETELFFEITGDTISEADIEIMSE